jgi:Reverse transcriptase (RNA-dependent DNA polymerase)
MSFFSRYECLRENSKGGGVLVFVHNDLEVTNVSKQSESFEKLKLLISKGREKTRIIAYYRAPQHDSIAPFLDDLEKELEASNLQTIIAGDMNINAHVLSARTSLVEPTCQSTSYESILKSYNYKVLNNLPTRPDSGKNIDHIITNTKEKSPTFCLTIEMDPSLTDHSIVLATIGKPEAKRHTNSYTERSSINLKKLSENFPNIEEAISALEDPNDITDLIYSSLHQAIAKSTQIRRFKIKHEENILEWTSSNTLSLIEEKNKLLNKRRKKPNSETIHAKLKTISAKLLNSKKNDMKIAINNKLTTKNPRKLWQNINSITGRKRKKKAPTRLITTDGTITEPTTLANTFNNFFATCAADLLNKENFSEQTSPLITESNINTMALLHPSHDEVQRAIEQLNNNAAPGHDGITARVLKCLKHEITPLMTHLTKKIFDKGIYPKAFKLAVVTPIHKNGSEFNVDNYRPISVLPILNKVVERLIHSQLTNFVDKRHKLLYTHQFGFRSNCGTDNAAIELANIILKEVDRNKRVSVVFMDLKKAFDIVDHKILSKVLDSQGIRGKALNLIENYLSDREQIVKVGDQKSTKRKITTGVVQGSCLGPLLYLLFFNAIGSLKLKGKLFLFADDAALVNIHDSTDEEALRTMSADMKTILEFLSSRRIIINQSKTNFMFFGTKNERKRFPHQLQITKNISIQRATSARYLGLIIDEELKWKQHVSHLNSKLSATGGMLWKLRILPKKTKKLLYDALFHSALSFMCQIWGTASYNTLNTTQATQNRTLRNVYEIPKETSRIHMYMNDVGTHLPVRGIATLNTLVHTYKIVNHITHSNIQLKETSTRRKSKRRANELTYSHANTTKGELAFEHLGPRLFNALPQEIKRCHHHHAFKQAGRSFLQNENFLSKCFSGRPLPLILE